MVKEMWNDDFDIPQIAALTVWKTKGKKLINKSNLERLADRLGSFGVDDKDTIQVEELGDEDRVADLGLSVDQTLLVQLPGTSHISTIVDFVLIPVITFATQAISIGARVASKVDEEFSHFNCLLQAETKGNFMADDIDLNRICPDYGEGPKFVKDYEELLSRKRRVAHNMRPFAEMLIDKPLFDEYFCSTEESSESSPIVNRPEMNHLIHLSSIDAMEWHPLSTGLFGEDDAYWLLFYAFANHCSLLPPNTTGASNIVVKRRQDDSLVHT
ncbi:hypothetical protein EI94DRAFT_1140636 [Lactarius quietus]|nr:hypothetical protein EI94DRAFT_1140636 [Lactarius quietus]